MPELSPAQQGFSLIEFMVAITIIGILVAAAAPSFSSWIENTRIRSAAETVLNGLQLARAEAVRRNTQVQFAFDGLPDSSWTVSCTTPVGDLNSDGIADCPGTATNPPNIQSRTSAEGTTSSTVAADQPTIIFNGLGRVTNVASASICIGNSGVSAACSAGTERRLKVVVLSGGQIRMCDPGLTATNPTDPQAC